jgi:hypothetical protein
MGLTSLVLIDEETMTRLDTGKHVFGSDVQILSCPMMMLYHKGKGTVRMNHKGVMKTANAVIQHKKYTSQLCSSSYCYVEGL